MGAERKGLRPGAGRPELTQAQADALAARLAVYGEDVRQQLLRVHHMTLACAVDYSHQNRQLLDDMRNELTARLDDFLNVETP